jgi:hypothetical protein
MVREASCRNPYSTYIPATSALSIFHGRERLGSRGAFMDGITPRNSSDYRPFIGYSEGPDS